MSWRVARPKQLRNALLKKYGTAFQKKWAVEVYGDAKYKMKMYYWREKNIHASDIQFGFVREKTPEFVRFFKPIQYRKSE